MEKITPIKVFSGNNIHELHKAACISIFEEGRDINFGDAKEQKLAREIDGTYQLYGGALKDVLNGKAPKGFLWQGKKIREFMEQFLDDQLNPKGFDYTYPEQLRAYSQGEEVRYDQLELTKEGLESDICSGVLNNRRVGVLWHPSFAGKREVPCFNWFQCRYQGDNCVSLRLLFRSHDWGTAAWANFDSIAYCFDELVFEPLGIDLVELICHSTSAHIYNNDAPEIEKQINSKWARLKAGWWK